MRALRYQVLLGLCAEIASRSMVFESLPEEGLRRNGAACWCEALCFAPEVRSLVVRGPGAASAWEQELAALVLAPA